MPVTGRVPAAFACGACLRQSLALQANEEMGQGALLQRTPLSLMRVTSIVFLATKHIFPFFPGGSFGYLALYKLYNLIGTWNNSQTNHVGITDIYPPIGSNVGIYIYICVYSLPSNGEPRALTIPCKQPVRGPKDNRYPLHGRCWETFHIFVYWGLAENPHLTAKKLPFQPPPS